MRRLELDLGATWLRARLLADGSLRRSARLPAVEWRELPAAVARLRRRWRWERLDELVVGSTRIGSAARRRELSRRLSFLARRVRVIPDVQLAYEAVFGRRPGVLINGGTGSIAVSRDAKGRWHRAGGLGPLLGDEGSAFWIGREALKRPALARRLPEGLALRLAHSDDAVRRTAALAGKVLAWARRGDRAAIRLREEAARHLAGLARELSGGRLPVVVWGSLFADSALKRTFLRRLKRRGA